MTPNHIMEVEIPHAPEQVDLVRELDRRDVDAAAATDGDMVLVAVPHAGNGEPLTLEALVALEAWLDRRDIAQVDVRVDGRTHAVRSRTSASTAGTRGRRGKEAAG